MEGLLKEAFRVDVPNSDLEPIGESFDAPNCEGEEMHDTFLQNDFPCELHDEVQHMCTKARAKMLKLRDSDGSKSTVEIENEAFQVELNGLDHIPERPQGYGFGVKKSDVYGVHGLLSKEGYGKFREDPLIVDVNVGISLCTRRMRSSRSKIKAFRRRLIRTLK